MSSAFGLYLWVREPQRPFVHSPITSIEAKPASRWLQREAVHKQPPEDTLSVVTRLLPVHYADDIAPASWPEVPALGWRTCDVTYSCKAGGGGATPRAQLLAGKASWHVHSPCQCWLWSTVSWRVMNNGSYSRSTRMPNMHSCVAPKSSVFTAHQLCFAN